MFFAILSIQGLVTKNCHKGNNMHTLFFKHLLKNRAFSVFELVMAMLIISTLMAIAVPQYEKAIERTRATEALSLTYALHEAMNTWVDENDGYPTTNTKFLGDSPDARLSIDVPTTVRNAKISYNGVAQTNYFRYNAYCGVNFCDVMADRITPDGTQQYRMFTRTYKEGTIDHKSCTVYNNSRIGEGICAWLRKDGWS